MASEFDKWMKEGLEKGYTQELDKWLRKRYKIKQQPTKEQWEEMRKYFQKEEVKWRIKKK